jgi:hypothetical protein
MEKGPLRRGLLFAPPAAGVAQALPDSVEMLRFRIKFPTPLSIFDVNHLRHSQIGNPV